MTDSKPQSSQTPKKKARKPKSPFGPGSNLRNATTFPTFRNCPEYDDPFGTPYYPDYGSFPSRHWACLGSIENFTMLGRLMIDAKDRDGKIFSVAMYTSDSGKGLLPVLRKNYATTDGFLFQPKEGKEKYTVVVMYPMSKTFLDGRTGFRVEDDEMAVRIIPHAGETILEANDLLHGTPTVEKCSACSKTKEEAGAPLSRCGRCKYAAYCGKECQTADWTATHKKMCKPLVELKWFTDKNWLRWTTWFEATDD